MSTMEIMTGNTALAHGARLARVQVIPIYPITPQTSIVEELAKFVANSAMEARMINVESEHSVCASVWGAELTGARCFTATASMGLGYMYEPLTFLHGNRLPIVIGVANRTLGAPVGVGGADYSDAMSIRDFGFIQFYAESNQEALDTVIQAYRIAEDPRVMLPVLVNVDGFYLSFSYELVSLPEQAEVDKFLPPFKPTFLKLDSDEPSAAYAWGPHLIHMEKQNEEAMHAALKVIEEVDEEFGQVFGRKYGIVEGYRTEDAEVILVTLGSVTGTAREVVDALREEGKPVGLLKFRTFRPFPTKQIWEIIKDAKVVAIIDRNVSHGGGGASGVACREFRTAFYGYSNPPVILNFVTSVGGTETSYADVEHMMRRSLEVAQAGRAEAGEEWMLPEIPQVPKAVPKDWEKRLLYPGSSSCAGCPETLIFRHILEEIGEEKPYIVMPPLCLSVTNYVMWPGISPVKVPFLPDMVFAATASGAAGVRSGLDVQGKDDNVVIAIAGDGGTADIGIQSLSAVANRGDPIVYICLDNEAYMNTGVQRSGTTPFVADTTTTPVGTNSTGNPMRPKDMPRIIADHEVPYVATASVAYIADFKKKLRKAVETAKQRKGLAYMHVHCPCPAGWRFATEKTIEIARLAVQTRLWDLYEVEDGIWKFTKEIDKPRPVSEYTGLQGRFKHLTEDQLRLLQEFADQKAASFAKLMDG